MTKKNQFYLPIGDWSNDGHGVCEKVLIESTASLQEIRDAHFKMEEVTGINIHKIANDYEDNTISSDTCLELIELGLDINSLLDGGYEGLTKENILDEEEYYIDSEGMAKMWVDLLNKTDESLKIVMVAEDEVPMIPFYGFDEQKRHMGFVGYGTLGN